MTSQATVENSDGAFWVSRGTGVWRIAKKGHVCDRAGCAGIGTGERYLDTGERRDVWANYKTCERHANWVTPDAPIC